MIPKLKFTLTPIITDPNYHQLSLAPELQKKKDKAVKITAG